MIQFILNNETIKTDESPGQTLLDFVRYHKRLSGTKIGCREGDCGACTLLMGDCIDGKMYYKSLTSCITPLGNAHGKHIVSIEGLNMEQLTPYQKAMVDTSGTQCGFCTVGFIVSFANACLSHQKLSYEDMIQAIDGNICRCTGYKSIERAAKIVCEQLQSKDEKDPVSWLIEHHFIPAYFSDIVQRITDLKIAPVKQGEMIIGGGSDLFVQKHDEIYTSDLKLISDDKELVGIEQRGDEIFIKAATNTTQLMESQLLKAVFPSLQKHLKLVSSTPVRNIATVAGNFVNASPIGDLTAFFLALNSKIELRNTKGISRIIYLKDFYQGYKILDKSEDEYIYEISFKTPDADTYFNFEKVSKRRYLDIASVNSSLSVTVKEGVIKRIHASAGGVAPIPKYLERTCAFLIGKELNEHNVLKAAQIMQSEISPISDVRGAKEYKRLLLRQLFYAHFMELFPAKFRLEALT